MKRTFTHFFILLSLLSCSVWANDSVLKHAYDARQSDIQVQGSGKVTRILADDNKGSRHQKFLLRLNNRQTILVAHNIDLAPRINDLNVGDTVQFYGEYEWNSKGGVIHWTHKDPRNNHQHGWLKHRGRIYN
ncbi:DUF3465 domain-containing protein [Moritella sp. 24]|uniref:DUF3465 domain-containing protein n=1 Tax=Moritella sp. 24 TaxID=2746230 RepID=UPI001BAB3593|nr:DUF3465 domain-containing protein [Moritella sp. 24]QUM75260.1 DUF3465 domain-containing protein [Moritella sp. 24]